MLAPGDGKAEPGVTAHTRLSPRSGRQMNRARNSLASSLQKHLEHSVARFAGSFKLLAITPGSASPSPGA